MTRTFSYIYRLLNRVQVLTILFVIGCATPIEVSTSKSNPSEVTAINLKLDLTRLLLKANNATPENLLKYFVIGEAAYSTWDMIGKTLHSKFVIENVELNPLSDSNSFSVFPLALVDFKNETLNIRYRATIQKKGRRWTIVELEELGAPPDLIFIPKDGRPAWTLQKKRSEDELKGASTQFRAAWERFVNEGRDTALLSDIYTDKNLSIIRVTMKNDITPIQKK